MSVPISIGITPMHKEENASLCKHAPGLQEHTHIHSKHGLIRHGASHVSSKIQAHTWRHSTPHWTAWAGPCPQPHTGISLPQYVPFQQRYAGTSRQHPVHDKCFSCLHLGQTSTSGVHNAQLIHACIQMHMRLVHQHEHMPPKPRACYTSAHQTLPAQLCAWEVNFMAHIYWYHHTHTPWNASLCKHAPAHPHTHKTWVDPSWGIPDV